MVEISIFLKQSTGSSQYNRLLRSTAKSQANRLIRLSIATVQALPVTTDTDDLSKLFIICKEQSLFDMSVHYSQRMLEVHPEFLVLWVDSCGFQLRLTSVGQ